MFKRIRESRLGQEELVGFALIVIIVAVILLFVLSFSLRGGTEELESFEVDSFIQSTLQYTTECRDNLEFFDVQQLIFECNNEASCGEGRDSCEVLEATLREISSESWPVGEGSVIKGYELRIIANGEETLTIEEGNVTASFKGSLQNFARSRDSVDVTFKAYF